MSRPEKPPTYETLDPLTRLRLAADAARLGDWSVDTATDEIDLSARAAEIFGVRPGRYPRAELRKVVETDDVARSMDKLTRALQARQDFDVQYRIRHADGATRWVSARGRGLYADDGNVVAIVGVVQDISELKETTEQLRAQTEALQTINEIGQLLSAELDLQRLVQALTDAATELTGARFGAFFYNVLDDRGGSYTLYTLSGVSREHFERFPMPRATPLFGPTFRGERVVRSGNIRDDPRYGQTPPHHGLPPGHLPVVSYLAVPVVSRTGEVLGGLFFGHPEPDIFTEQHERIVVGLAGQAAIAMDNARFFEAAQRSREAAETANRLKDEFLATVSHELRTPLNAIMGWARMLSTGTLDESQRTRAIETIERNAVVQQRIIEDILDVSRIITGKLRLECTLIDLLPAVTAAIDGMRPSAAAKGVRMVTSLDANLDPVIGDASRVQQIVWNLVSNAIKFTPRDGTVTISLQRIDSFVEIAVADTGRGIGREFLPHVFDRFRQGDASTTRTHGGLGLGLAIVRHLTELHGGTVMAHSEGEGKGSIFTVRLPLQPTVVSQQSTSPGSMPAAVPWGDGAAHAHDLNGVRVLVVDDEADARELVRVVLSQAGAEIETAGSVQQAVALFHAWCPDVIVCDLAMPGEDGYSFIHHVRALPADRGGTTPAAALTAYARSEDRDRVMSAGFQMHVTKPTDPAELRAAVLRLVSSRSQPQA